jgi:hypothetical protein
MSADSLLRGMVESGDGAREEYAVGGAEVGGWNCITRGNVDNLVRIRWKCQLYLGSGLLLRHGGEHVI